MPLIILSLIMATVVNLAISLIENEGIQRLSFLGWALPLLIASYVTISAKRKISFPFWIWIPWVFWVLVYCYLSDYESAFQRSVMLVTPIVISMACSTIQIDIGILHSIHRKIVAYAKIFFFAGITVSILAALKSTIFIWSMAAGSISASLLAVYFATRYAFFRSKKDLLLWLMMLSIPVVYVTRTGIIATALTLPFTLAKWPWRKRALTLLALMTVGVALFYTDRVQSKMFISGQGTLLEAISNAVNLITGSTHQINEDFRTNARQAMQQMIASKIDESYWLGHGANAVEAITINFSGLTHPHNDWLRIQYDYGSIGVLIFAITIIVQGIHAIRTAKLLPVDAKIFMLVGASAFVPMSIFMFTDNVIIYVSWFGNLQMAFIGLAYAYKERPMTSARYISIDYRSYLS